MNSFFTKSLLLIFSAFYITNAHSANITIKNTSGESLWVAVDPEDDVVGGYAGAAQVDYQRVEIRDECQARLRAQVDGQNRISVWQEGFALERRFEVTEGGSFVLRFESGDLVLGESGTYMCDVFRCHFSAMQRYDLKRHKDQVHLAARFVCAAPGCDYSSVHKSNLRRHQDAMHSFVRHVCDEPGCGYSAASRGDLRRHQEYCHSARYVCDEPGCHYSTRHMDLLTAHKDIVHPKEQSTLGKRKESQKPVDGYDADGCCVCLEEFDSEKHIQVMLAPCSHKTTCKSCIDGLLSRPKTCPMCRANIDKVTELTRK